MWMEFGSNHFPRVSNRRKRLLLGLTLLKHARQLNGKLYIFHDPELFGVGLVLRILGKHVIYDCHENLPMQLLQKNWIPKPLRRILAPLVYFFEGLFSRLMSGVIVANDCVVDRFPKNRTSIIRNLPPARSMKILAEGRPIEQRENIVIYTGGMSRIRGLVELVEAFRGLEGFAELWLVGFFHDTDAVFRERTLSSLPENVRWLGFKSHIEVLRLYQSAKVGAMTLHPTPNHRNIMPVKLFEYLGAGLPVLASDMPEYTPAMEGCGLQVDPTNVEQIRTGIRKLLSDPVGLRNMSKNARERVATKFSWEIDARRLIGFCQRFVNRARH